MPTPEQTPVMLGMCVGESLDDSTGNRARQSSIADYEVLEAEQSASVGVEPA